MEPKTKFAVGDVVQLKSGGPAMTVSSDGGQSSDRIFCEWFWNNELRSAHFPPETLTIAK
jgi:uncharacterized protein YodC (DUF2158 family)